MNATKSHTKTVTDDVYERYRDKWEALARNEIDVWLKFHRYWLSSERPVPVLIVRFEDLIREPKAQLQRMMQFALQTDRLSPLWEERAERTVGSGSTDRLGSYRPRAALMGAAAVGRALRTGRYTEELLLHFRDAAAKYNPDHNHLKKLGYALADGFPANFWDGTEPPLTDVATTDAPQGAVVTVNVGGETVRPNDCPFGRLMQKWRHSVTNNDRNPLPTVDRNCTRPTQRDIS
jgi:hypothetical protein